MTATEPASIAPAQRKLGVLCVGLGAVTRTLIAAKRAQSAPRGAPTTDPGSAFELNRHDGVVLCGLCSWHNERRAGITCAS
jgi:hypothetical protein